MNLILPPHNKKSEPVKNLEEIRQDAELMSDLIRRNYFKSGIWKQAYALAHCQVSENPKRFFVVNKMDPYVKKNFKSDIIINPVIEHQEMETTFREGCMSMPYRGTQKVRRYNYIKVSYYVPRRFFRKLFGDFKRKVESASGLKAMIIQHECEHLEGIY